jgi:hypothetical protein
MKIEIEIVRAIEKIKGWQSDLEDEERRMLARLATAQNDKKQLMLFDELPVLKVAPRKAAKKAGNGKTAKLKLVEPDEQPAA